MSSPEHKHKVAQGEALVRENESLRRTIANLKSCANRFFNFEMEEDEFQAEFKRCTSALKKTSSSQPANTLMNPNANALIPFPKSFANAGNAKSSSSLGKARSRLQYAGGSIASQQPLEGKFRVRTNIAGKGPGTDESIQQGETEEEKTKSLAEQIKEQKKRLSKHKKLQEWLAEKAQRELDQIELEKRRREEQANEEALRNVKWKKHANQVKQKLKRVHRTDGDSNANDQLDDDRIEFNFKTVSTS